MPRGMYKRTPEQLEKLRQQCKNDSRLGFKKGNEPKNKFEKGNKYSFEKGSIPWNKGKMGEQVKCVQSFKSGEEHHNWNGGVTKERVKIWHSVLYKVWRMAVFMRDDYTCVWCGARNGEGKNVYLEADHIKPFAEYPDLRFDLFNGRTLCRECHRKTDTYGVRKKATICDT